uniref:HDC13381 n=1 Tax=Drosophila melanogaster TaxID=7227 RepID=Q6IK49_DROME|nr:TPA_inf: HDC13381 [Drosophila melanogaster]
MWLNEFFASFLEYKGVKQMHPEWNIDNQTIIRELLLMVTIDLSLPSDCQVHLESCQDHGVLRYHHQGRSLSTYAEESGLVRHIYRTEDYLAAVEKK